MCLMFIDQILTPNVKVFAVYLFESERLGSFLRRSCLPHTDGGAGASGDDQLQVGTDGAEDLTPLGQTFVHHQRLAPDPRGKQTFVF